MVKDTKMAITFFLKGDFLGFRIGMLFHVTCRTIGVNAARRTFFPPYADFLANYTRLCNVYSRRVYVQLA